jgi:hypothetical protein
VLKTAISDVRAALGDDPKRPRYIETVSRRGYRFIGAGAPGSAAAAERSDAARIRPEALTVLTALCRGDPVVADLIRTVAASLDQDRLVVNC